MSKWHLAETDCWNVQNIAQKRNLTSSSQTTHKLIAEMFKALHRNAIYHQAVKPHISWLLKCSKHCTETQSTIKQSNHTWADCWNVQNIAQKRNLPSSSQTTHKLIAEMFKTSHRNEIYHQAVKPHISWLLKCSKHRTETQSTIKQSNNT